MPLPTEGQCEMCLISAVCIPIEGHVGRSMSDEVSRTDCPTVEILVHFSDPLSRVVHPITVMKNRFLAGTATTLVVALIACVYSLGRSIDCQEVEVANK